MLIDVHMTMLISEAIRMFVGSTTVHTHTHTHTRARAHTHTHVVYEAGYWCLRKVTW